MFQCERCCKPINSNICPHCKYDNTQYIKDLNISLEDEPDTIEQADQPTYNIEDSVISLGGQLGSLGGSDIRIKSVTPETDTNEAIEKDKSNKTTEKDENIITIKINKKFAAVIFSVALILIFSFSFIHTCDNCNKVYFGKEYHSFGGDTCKSCYEYFIS